MIELLNDILKVNQSAANIDAALLILRVAIGLMMLNHGIPKIKKLLSPEPIHFFKTFGLSETNSLKTAAFVEVFFSSCLILGLGTQIIVIPLLFTMIIAAFYTLKSQPFDKKELPILYLVVYLTILFCGAGKYSLDYMLFGLK
jgi:putative oxidoreductase